MLTDDLGSVRDVMDNSRHGAGVDQLHQFRHATITGSNPAAAGRYLWTGREYDSLTGLQYNRGRYYDPSTGRWISQDPMGFDAGDSNLYRYVNNDPTSATDPSGLDALADLTNQLSKDDWMLVYAPAAYKTQTGTVTSNTPLLHLKQTDKVTIIYGWARSRRDNSFMAPGPKENSYMAMKKRRRRRLLFRSKVVPP